MAFAEAEDVAIRLGRSLTDPEAQLVEQVIESVTGQIVGAVDRDADWATALDPVPEVLKALCIEKAIAVGSNPNGLAARSKTLGSFSSSETFRRSTDGGILLSEEELALARSAIYDVPASARLESIIDDVLDMSDNGLLDKSLPAG